MGIFTWIWDGIKSLGGLIMPVFAKAGELRGLTKKLRWVIHFALVAIILVLLTFLNYAFDLEKLLTPPLPYLRKVWLPLLFLQIYLLMWLGWWLWTLLVAEEASSDYPDIDEAWDQAVAQMKQAGIDVSEAPVFLLLGKPDGGERALFEGAELEFLVANAPERPDAPMQIFANKDAIFITCAGASLLGKQAMNYASAAAAAQGPVSMQREGGVSASDSAALPIPAAARSGARESVSLSGADVGASVNLPSAAEDKTDSTIGSVSTAPPRTSPMPRPLAKTPLLKDTAELERLTNRLRHLCWLMVKERRPFCPVNGILLMVPYAATATDSEANQTGIICQRDLDTVRDVLQINCPVLALVTDMEKALGFKEFIERFPKGHRQRRLGQQFPYVNQASAADRNRLVEEGVEWICSELFPSLIYRLMRQDRTKSDRAGSSPFKGNVRLFNLLTQMRDRRRRLMRVLALGLEMPETDAVYFGGCYFAGTGRNAPREQAFIAAVFHRLLEGQNYVAWTKGGMAEENDYRRWSRLGYTALAAFLSTMVVFGYFFGFRR
jgi:hypothetical protein